MTTSATSATSATSTAASGTVPATKAARHARIVQLLVREQIHSQAELARALARDGLHVTQATLSRDLIERTAGECGFSSMRLSTIAGQL